jgi:hypothetical protein
MIFTLCYDQVILGIRGFAATGAMLIESYPYAIDLATVATVMRSAGIGGIDCMDRVKTLFAEYRSAIMDRLEEAHAES